MRREGATEGIRRDVFLMAQVNCVDATLTDVGGVNPALCSVSVLIFGILRGCAGNTYQIHRLMMMYMS